MFAFGTDVISPLAAQKTYYMDPEGEDTNPGTESKPLLQ